MVSGRDPNGTEATGGASLTTDGPARAPALEATKVALPAPGIVGSTVDFVLTVENTGNVTLTNVSITDQMTNFLGGVITLDAPFARVAASDAGSDNALSVGERWTYTAQLTLTQAIVNSGGVNNQVTVVATDPSGGSVLDLSDNGIDTDGNTSDDQTVFEISSEPELSVIKSVETTGSAVGDEVVFVITATNVGNVALSDVTAKDTLTRANGDPLTATPVARSVPDPLNSGEAATWEVRHTITQEDVDAGGLSNTAAVTGTAPDDTTVTDISADDDLTDGNTTDDPTE